MAKKPKKYKSTGTVFGDIDYVATEMFGKRVSTDSVNWLSTGITLLDLSICKGLPGGKLVEIYGSEGCLAPDTFISYCVVRPDGTVCNSKGGTIENLYNRFHGKKSRWGTHLRKTDVSFTAPSINEDGRIFHNRIVDVVKTGVQECFELITESGLSIKATGDHKFFNGNTYVKLSDLSTGEMVMVHKNVPFKKDSKPNEGVYRNYLYVKQHPIAGRKCVKALVGKGAYKEYSYCRLARSRAVVEAALNGISLESYIEILNSENEMPENMVFLNRDEHVHHIDEDFTNDSLSNLAVIKAPDHNRSHALKEHNNLRYVAVPDKVKEIVSVGDLETFDIKMESPFNNYVANKFVVHNSGKSSIAMSIVKQAQQLGGYGVWLDSEQSFDNSLARDIIGMNVDVGFIHRDMCFAEDALEFIERTALRAVSSPVPVVFVLDSIAGLCPKTLSLEEESIAQGKRQTGKLASIMSWWCSRGLLQALRGTNVYLVFLNQTRDVLDFYGFGKPPDTTPGGKALRFFSSVRIAVNSSGLEQNDREKKDAKSPVVGIKIRTQVVKNRFSQPYREAVFPLYFRKDQPVVGIDDAMSCLRYLKDRGALTISGSWLELEGVRAQGVLNMRDEIVKNPTFYGKVKDLVKQCFREEYGEIEFYNSQPETAEESKADEGYDPDTGEVLEDTLESENSDQDQE